MDRSHDEMIWGYLVHLGYNMWSDRPADRPNITAQPRLRFDEGLWNELIAAWSTNGVNMVVIDLGEGVRYESHPELAVEGSWSPSKLQEELGRLRECGLEPVPKLNFSTAHDVWLGEYARCVSTERYYAVCRDLIAEVLELFGGPRFFHLGMDEETAQHQRNYAYAVMRQHELWWHDIGILFDAVEKGGARPWIWSDYVWHHPDEFFENMPPSVLQSNWYYDNKFDEGIDYVKAYLDLDRHGYDQVPTGSNWSNDENFEGTVTFCKQVIKPGLLKGFLHAPWHPTLEAHREHHLNAVAQMGRARKTLEG